MRAAPRGVIMRRFRRRPKSKRHKRLKKGVDDAEEQTPTSSGIPGGSGAPGPDLGLSGRGDCSGAGGDLGGRSSQACAVTGQLTAEREEIAAGSADPAGGTGSPEGTREVRDFTGTAGEGAAAVFAQRTVQAVEAFGQVGARGGANHGVARRGIEGLPSSYYV
jgi:hypothetical protein